MTLSDLERERYSHQLADWGEEGQERLGAASAIVVGLGALGSPVALYLAAAGVGRMGVVDPAVVEMPDLTRQPLHFTPDLGVPKAQNAAVKLRALNPEIVVEPYPALVDAENAFAIVAGADVVVDSTGGLGVNDACCAGAIPLVWGSPAGDVLTVRPGETACVRCAEPPPAAGRLPGAAAGVVGSLLALEALNLITGAETAAAGTLLRVEGAAIRRAPVTRRDECPSCAVPAGAPLS